MEERFNQHTVLTYASEKGKVIEIIEGMIVSVKIKDEKHCGRVTFIDTGFLEVDCSKKYQQDVRQFKYKEIDDIWVIK